MEHLALSVTNNEVFASLIAVAFSLAVAVASYRRSRCLSKYPIWQSLLIAALAGNFMIFWLLNWWFDRREIAQEWRDYRASRLTSVA